MQSSSKLRISSYVTEMIVVFAFVDYQLPGESTNLHQPIFEGTNRHCRDGVISLICAYSLYTEQRSMCMRMRSLKVTITIGIEEYAGHKEQAWDSYCQLFIG